MTLFHRVPLAGVLLGALALSPIAVAQQQGNGIDITRMTCAQLTDMPRAEQEQFLTWLYGYYAGSAQKAVIDRGAFLNSTRLVGDYCAKQKTAPLIGAQIRAMFLPGGQPGEASTPDVARGPAVTGPAVLAPAEGAQRITLPQAGVLDPSTTSALPRPGESGAASRALIDALSAPPTLVPSRPTPQ